MIPLAALLIGATAAVLTSLVMAIGPGGPRRRTIRGLVTFSALVPFLWLWAGHTDQFPATFGGFLVTQVGLQRTHAFDRMLNRRRH